MRSNFPESLLLVSWEAAPPIRTLQLFSCQSEGHHCSDLLLLLSQTYSDFHVTSIGLLKHDKGMFRLCQIKHS